MKKVIILSLDSISNGGDQMLGDTTEYLIENKHSYDIERVQLMPNDTSFKKKYFIRFLISHLIIRLSRLFRNSMKYRIIDKAFKVRYAKFYSDSFKNADYIIYSLGMLKYSTQNFSYIVECINKIASKYGIKVLMSAMSIEKPNFNDWRFYQLVRSVNYSCVKMITTRDGINGLDRLRNFYIKNDNIFTDYVGDPALWAPECYKISKKRNEGNSIKLGIGLVRLNIYESYKGGKSRNELFEFYKSFVKSISEDSSFDYYLFCNGMPEDYSVGEKLVEELNLDQNRLIPSPNSAKKLLEIVSGFDLVFGARLHSCITSVSLEIPVSGLLWDNKLDFFSETMGIREFFSEADELAPPKVLKKLMSAYNASKSNVKDAYKIKTKESINYFLSEF